MKKRFTLYEREKIEFYLKLKFSKREIGRRLKRSHTDVVREVRRNQDKAGNYTASAAQKKADLKAKKTNKRKLESDQRLHDYVAQKLKEGWSPEQISGRLKKQPPAALNGQSISHEQIYDYIYEGEGRWEGWYHCLRYKRPKRRKRGKRKKQLKKAIPERISIHNRPAIAESRKRLGDWESDLAAFKKQRQALSVQYERKAMLTRIHKTENKTAYENEQAIMKTADSLPGHLFKTMTFDNGPENVCHLNIRDSFNLATYFCDAYAAWQKGGVENTIGLIREYLPKGADLSTITEKELFAIQERLNNRPRKKLSYLTPNEVIEKELNLDSGALNS